MIAISAAMHDDMQKGEEAGFHSYHSKPLQTDKLYIAIHEALTAGEPSVLDRQEA